MVPVSHPASSSAPDSGTKNKGPHKKHPKLPAAGRGDIESHTNGALRNTIRNLERLLKRVDKLPPGVVDEKERELSHLKATLAGKGAGQVRRSRGKEERKAVSKYHGIRFFERQKATRRLKKLRTQLAHAQGSGDQDILQGLEERVHEAEVDLNYTVYSPLGEKYSSLFVAEDRQAEQDGQSLEKRRERKPRWWLEVETATKEGKLDDLRESRWPERLAAKKQIEPARTTTTAKRTVDVSTKPPPRALKIMEREREAKVKGPKHEMGSKTQQPTRNRRERRRNVPVPQHFRQDEDDDSEGGFFDE